MRFSLATLPSEILDAILSFGYSQIVVDLWLSGDRMMQRNISQGVTSIHLLNTIENTLARFPKMIAQLPKLRSLVVDRNDSHLLHYQEVSKYLKALPSTLTKLSLRFHDASSLFAPGDPDLRDLYASSDTAVSKDDDWTAKEAFPQLHTLKIVNNKWNIDFSTLPLSLTKLAIGLPYHNADQEQFFRNLPRQLQHLTLLGLHHGSQMRADHWRHLPPTLTYFSSDLERIDYDFSGSEVALLPRTLTKLELPMLFEMNSPEHVKSFPPNITHITNSFFADASLVPDDLGLMFPSLTNVYLRASEPLNDSRSLLRQLPAKVTNLCIGIDMSIVEKEDWPQHLRELSLSRSSCNFRINALPSHLLTLNLSASAPIQEASDISLLPRTLTKLRVWFTNTTNKPITFPPLLKELTLISDTEDPWLTAKLTAAELDALSEDDRARVLRTERGDGAITRLPTPSADAVYLFYKLLNGATVLECFPFHDLPRSLPVFKTNLAVPASQLKHLPPDLTYLDLDLLFIDSDFHPQEELKLLRAGSTLRKNNVLEKFDWNSLSEASITSVLPRSLATLRLKDSPTGQNPLDFAHMPPRITDLTLQSHDYGFTQWCDIMKLPLKELTLNLATLDDAHCKAAARTLEWMNLTPRDASQVTPEGFLYLPPNTSLSIDCSCRSELNGMDDRRRKLYRTLLQNNDYESFRKLMHISENHEFCMKLLDKH